MYLSSQGWDLEPGGPWGLLPSQPSLVSEPQVPVRDPVSENQVRLAGKGRQWVKMPLTENDDPSSVPTTHLVDWENWLLQTEL